MTFVIGHPFLHRHARVESVEEQRNIPTCSGPTFSGMNQTRVWRLFWAAILMSGATAFAQDKPNTQFYLYGHLTSNLELEDNAFASDFSLGEHDLFVQSTISPRFSFLSETVVGPVNSQGHSAADYKVSLERARLKYEYREWLSVIVGKMHTPVNYWNDVYHHGRLFFPVIDRPRSFGTSVPIHTLGLRLQGQNIGKLKFGYDLVVGNGMSSNDVTDGSAQKSITAAVHIKPEKRTRISLSAYRDVIYNNMVGAHAGHGGPYHYSMGELGFYPVDLDFELYCFSVYRNKGNWEMLLETTLNRTGLNDGNDPDLVNGLDSLGTSNNTTLFFYAGHKVGKRGRLYGLVDLTDYEERDLHIKSNQLAKFGLGWQHEFSPLVKSQIQVERYTGRDGFEIPADDKWELKFRIAYCLF
jgi:hypothetical protein